jgi:hypothetical protein
VRFSRRKDLGAVDLLELDVEGSQVRVLRGTGPQLQQIRTVVR